MSIFTIPILLFIIAVDEILEECRLQKDWYWEEVKQEINKL